MSGKAVKAGNRAGGAQSTEVNIGALSETFSSKTAISTLEDVEDEDEEAPAVQARNLFLLMPEISRRIFVGMLNGNELARFDTAMVHHRGHAALQEAMNGTDVYGSEFRYQLESKTELCEGLAWMRKRNILPYEFTLHMYNKEGKYEKEDHICALLQRAKFIMASLIITRCLKSYDPNAWSERIKCFPLMMATALDSPEHVRQLCARKDVNVNQLEDFANGSYSCLQRACHKGHFECLEILIDEGNADYKKQTSDATCLHLSALFGHIDCVAFLLERGMSINLLNSFGETPLDWALRSRKAEMITFLKSKGARMGEQITPPAPAPPTEPAVLSHPSPP